MPAIRLLEMAAFEGLQLQAPLLYCLTESAKSRKHQEKNEAFYQIYG
jgi:hypothetical protein